MNPKTRPYAFLSAIAVACLLLSSAWSIAPPAAYAQPGPGYPRTSTGYDISWPQCGSAYPSRPYSISIVGADDGHPMSENPCFASEAAWAGTGLEAYFIVDIPSQIDTSSTSGPCNPSTYKGDVNLCYAYNRGWNTAKSATGYVEQQSFHPWMYWLDVEGSICGSYPTNCFWSSTTGYNDRNIQGALDELASQNLTGGIYSSVLNWTSIAGSSYNPAVPAWVAWYSGKGGASNCATAMSYAESNGDSLPSGGIVLTQYASDTYDHDYACMGPPSAPANVTARPGNGVAAVSWSAPSSTNGGPVTYYVVTPYENGQAQAAIDTKSSSTGLTVPGLVNGNQYTFTATAINAAGMGPLSAASAPVVPTSPGFWMVASDGGIFSFGDAQYHGSMGGKPLNEPIVGMAPTPDGDGYWEVASDGGIFSFGDAVFHGSEGGKPLNEPVVGMASTPDGGGYWLVASDGGIFSFGDAVFHGSEGGKILNEPIVGMAATADGGGYWLVASDGGIFSFGDAVFHGSEGSSPPQDPIVGMTATPDGQGYWMVGSDGAVYNFGDARYLGSEKGQKLPAPAVGMTPNVDGAGYWLASSDGNVYPLGDAESFGSMAGKQLNAPVVAISVR